MKKGLPLAIGTSLMLVGAASQAADLAVGISQRQALAATLYTGGVALINDQRVAHLSKGINRLEVSSISPRVIPDSLQVSAGADFIVTEQAVLPANLTQAELLKSYLGKTIQIANTHPATGSEIRKTAQVLSVDPQLILRIDGHIETSLPGRPLFPEIPDTLRSQPVFNIIGQKARTADAELSLTYLAHGLSWQPDHIATFDKTAGSLTVQSRASLVNNSGLDLINTRLQMVAGDINQVSSVNRGAQKMMLMSAEAAVRSDGPPQPTRQALGGFHLYQLPNAIDLKDGESKQVSLMAPQTLPAKRTLVSTSYPHVFGRHRPPVPAYPQIEIELINDPLEGEKMPLPAGVFRLYGTDDQRQSQFLGENRLPNLPVGETARLVMGQAFDVTVHRKQTDFQREGLAKNTYEAAFDIRIQNGGDQPEQVLVKENLAGDWSLINGTEHFKRDGTQAVWHAEVPAGGEVLATYRVRVRR